MEFDEKDLEFLRNIMARLAKNEAHDTCDCGACRMNRGEIDRDRYLANAWQSIEAVLDLMDPLLALVFMELWQMDMQSLHMLMLYTYGDGFNYGLEVGRKEAGRDEAGE